MPKIFQKISIALRSVRRESEKGLIYAIGWFVMRFYYRFLHPRATRRPAGSEQLEGDELSVVVPVVEKDAELLKHCLAAANEMLRHPLRAKWVVGPESQKLRAIAAAAGWEFVHEDKLLPRPASELKCRGWMLQQLIKLNASHFVPTDRYLVLDADTIFLKPQLFSREGKTVLRYSDQYELLYNRSLELIFGHKRRWPVSFVTHHMVFNKHVTKEIFDCVEQRFGMPWWKAILKEIDQGHLISFSEFELYGNFVVSQPKWKRGCLLEYWDGLDKYSEDLPDLSRIQKQTDKQWNSVSFHWHTQ